MKPFKQDLWQSAADDVFSVLLTEQYLEGGENAYNRAVFEEGLSRFHFPAGKWRELFRVVFELRTVKKSLTWHHIAEVAPASITQQWYTELVTLVDEVRIADFDDNVHLLKQFGQRLDAIEAFESAAKSLRAGEDVEHVVNSTLGSVSVRDHREIQGETAADGASRLRSILSGTPDPVVPTGFDFIDEVTGGLRAQRLWMVAGPYKSRKTTVGYNILLNAYRAGKRPAILSLENTYDTMLATLTAMLAIEWLLKHDHAPTYAPDASVYWISADGLLQAKSGYKKWTSLKVQAIDYALNEIEKIGDGIRFYDTSAKYGALSDFASIRGVIQRDMRLYDGDVYIVDHQGLVDGQGEIYEDTRSVSKAFQRLSRIDNPHTITLIVLAQLNENAVKGESGYSAGVKGGGDSAANCDVLLTTTPIPLPGSTSDFCDDRTHIKVKFNRWGGTTTKREVIFHPESGLKMPSKTIDLTEYSMNGSGAF
jgi:replicative DNA helicase